MKLLLAFTLLTVSVSVSVSAPAHRPPSCPCGRVYMPVCASNGATYNNMCEFDCAQQYYASNGVYIRVIRPGRCEESVVLSLLSLQACGQRPGFAEKDCVCTSQYDPACGSDGRHYYNICTFECRLEYLRRHGLPMIDRVDCRLLPPPAPIH